MLSPTLDRGQDSLYIWRWVIPRNSHLRCRSKSDKLKSSSFCASHWGSEAKILPKAHFQSPHTQYRMEKLHFTGESRKKTGSAVLSQIEECMMKLWIKKNQELWMGDNVGIDEKCANCWYLQLKILTMLSSVRLLGRRTSARNQTKCVSLIQLSVKVDSNRRHI